MGRLLFVFFVIFLTEIYPFIYLFLFPLENIASERKANAKQNSSVAVAFAFAFGNDGKKRPLQNGNKIDEKIYNE